MLTKEQAWELTLLALCAWREARDQGAEGMLAVCWSVRNRVLKPGKTWWGDDWEEVVLAKAQYSSFNPGDPNATLLPGDPTKDPSWAAALDAAERAYYGLGVDPSLGATHYYATSIPAPAWTTAPGTIFRVQIGAHKFYTAS